MKFLSASVAYFAVSLADAQDPGCPYGQPPTADSIGIQIEKVGNVPTDNVFPYSYNMFPAGGFEKEGFQFFIDQLLGKVYSYDSETMTTSLVFDMSVDEVPPGLTLDWTYGLAFATQKIHNMVPGNDGEVIVVFTSTTLPDGWEEPDFSLPAPVSREQCDEDPPNIVPDIYNMSTLDPCWEFGGGWLTVFHIYPTFVKYTISEDGKFTNPVPFFTYQQQIGFGHAGGGILPVPMNNGRKQILWATGDCIVFGFEGDKAPQVDDEICGKILQIDPDVKGSAKVVAKGVRNSQQFQYFREGNTKTVAFMDIGGVTREEINAIPLDQLLDTDVIDNFGWGINQDDNKAREGTFYVGEGKGGILGTQPPCEGEAPVPEDGFIQPWIQFERIFPEEAFYSISGIVVNDNPKSIKGSKFRELKAKKAKKGKKGKKGSKSDQTKSPKQGKASASVSMMPFDTLKVVWSELNTGKLMGTTDSFKEQGMYTGPAETLLLRIFNEKGEEMANHLNDLMTEELGEEPGRLDARPFMFVDGTAGIFIERTGSIYRMKEINI